MQTFLPYADFRESARSLDPARLGKQRVEALQVLRAIVFPTYGWQNHPAMQMWRGYVPALTRYALDMVDTWTELGHADTTRPRIAEFAPEADGTPVIELPTPSWLGDEELHLSHRSNLVRKSPEYYRQLFGDVADDLPYVWPGADPIVAADVPLPVPIGEALWILRPKHAAEGTEWVETGGITLAEVSPRGKLTRNWQAQLEQFADLPTGARIGVLAVDGSFVHSGVLAGAVTAYRRDGGEVGLRRAAQFGNVLARSEFGYPALLQDPRSLFSVVNGSHGTSFSR